MNPDLPVAIVIPVHNRQTHIAKAIAAALDQSHPDCVTIVIDDGSSDATWQEMARFAAHPRVALLRMARNLGTGPAKNIGILLAGERAVTFHDSDDRPHPDKLLRQARALSQAGLQPDPGLNWGRLGPAPPHPLEIGAVFTHHHLILPDGRRRTIRRDISIVDDIFPNIQLGARGPGDWLHVNSGLFHPRVFARLGGFADSIEEDRDFRNRLILSGQAIWIIEEPLLTKIETRGSLTRSAETGHESPARRAARAVVWRDVADWMRSGRIRPLPIDLPENALAEIVNPGLLAPSSALTGPGSRRAVAGWLAARA